ncbi:MAG: double-strand break repair helicase AddA [Rhodospirillales bacterium]
MSERMTETRRQATEIQQTAGRPGDSFWVSANAGTGKTHVLTNRIVRLLMSGVKPHTILCLTYTKAAATEMANRLGALLGKWAVMSNDALMESYRDQTGVPLDRDDLSRVRKLFAEVADTTDGPNIRTIHSFCESLLGRFPLEAGVAPHFAVMDERTAAELRSEARDRVLARAAVDAHGPAGRAMDHLAGVLGETGFDDLVTELDFARGKLAALFARHGGARGLAGVTRNKLGLAPDADRRSVILNAPPADEVNLRRAANALSGGKKTDKDRSQLMAPWLAGTDDEKTDGFDDYAQAYLTKTHTALARLITKDVESQNPGTLSVLEAEQTRVLAIDEQLRALAIAQNTSSLMNLAEVLAVEYAALKEARALMDYDDLILKTRALLAPDNPARRGAVAWVQYKLDGGIAHILVDEAQDTAPAQWDILKALADEFFAGDGAWDGDEKGARTVFAVGDEKQSIYSFQGAEPARFEQTRAYFAARAGDAEIEHRLDKSLEMAVSFRSTWPVLDTVDRTFEPEDLRASVTTTDRAIRHVVDRDGDAGRVELWPTLTPEEEDEADAWDAPVDKPGPRAPLVQVAETIADAIRGWLDDGEVLPASGRPVSAGDILILVRKRGQFMAEMVRQLKLRDIRVAGTDRMILTEQMAVMDLIALGRFVLLPDDDLTLATVLKGPLFNFTDDDDLTPLCYPRRGTLWAELRERAGENAKWRQAADRLAALLAAADQAPPFEFFADLLGPGGGRKAFHRHLGQDALDPIEEFLALALQFEREHPPSLEGFLHWVGAGETVVKRDMDQAGDKVRVMTVHGAKGLEAPIVFLPDTCQAGGRGKPIGLLWDDEAVYWPGRKDDDCDLTADLRARVSAAREDEERRLLYVAMTRARDRLYITGWETKTGRADGCWYDLIAAGLERAGAKELTHPLGIGLYLDWPQTAPVTPKDTAHAGPGMPAPDWLSRPPADEPDPPRPLAPSKPEDSPPAASPLGEDDGARFKRGLIVHRLLESLPDIEHGQRAAAAGRFLARPALELDDRAQAEILAETLAVLDDPALAGLFGPESRAEVPLVALSGGRVITARIDRLLVTDDEILIADFKTNRPPPTRIEDVQPAYIAQMAGYRRALMDLYPERPVRCALIWTLGARLMVLPDAVLDAAGAVSSGKT